MSEWGEDDFISTAEVFSLNLNRLLEARGRNAYQLATYLDVAPNSVYGWTKGKTSPQIGKLDDIASFLGVSVTELFGRPREAEVDAHAESSAVTAISRSINRLLDQAGQNPNQLAKHLGIHSSTVYSWCKGETAPQVAKFDEIASFLGVTVPDLFRATTDSPPDLRALYRMASESIVEIEVALIRALAVRGAIAKSLGIANTIEAGMGGRKGGRSERRRHQASLLAQLGKNAHSQGLEHD